MRKTFARSILFTLTIMLLTAFANHASAQTTVDDLIFGSANKNIIGISAPLASTTVVINEVYGGGGNSGAPYNQDFVELYNKSGASIDLAGYAVQYTGAAGTTYESCIISSTNTPGGTTIAAGGYFLLSFASGTTGIALTGVNTTCGTSINLAATAGKVSLTSTSTALSGSTCPPTGGTIVDFVGYGTGTNGANCFEGTAAAPTGSNTTSIQRFPNGSDTDSNSADFQTTAPTPKAANVATTPGIIQFSSPTYSVTEGTATVTITATRTGGTDGSVSATYATSNGSAVGGTSCSTAGVDYITRTGSISFANGSATNQTFTITICNDTLIENDETVNLTLSAPTGGATLGTNNPAVLTITDNDGTATQPSVSLSVSSNTTSEPSGTVTVTATASSAPTSAQTVNLTLTGTAINGTDYTIPATITIAANTTTGTATFAVLDDQIFEGSETATITISSITGGATIGTPNSQTVTIADNETAPTFSINSVTQAEGNSGTTNFVFTVTKTGATSLGSTVTYSTANGTATAGSDYTATAGTLTFAAGDTSMTISVPVTGDVAVEGNETFTVTIAAGTNATVSNATGTGTITNDDTAPTITLSPASLSNGTVGTTYNQTITAAGGTAPYTFTATGTLPNGLTLSSNGALTGTPTTAGTFNFTVAATDANGFTGSRAYTITISAAQTAPTITSAGSATFTVGTAGSFTVTTTGNPTPAISKTGNLPSGVTFTDNGNGTATIAGTPASGSPGTYTLTLTATNSVGSATQTFTLTVNPPASGVTLGNPSCQGLANVPLRANTARNALMCFSLSANNGAQLTGLIVRFTSDPSVKYANPKLYSSTDTNYATQNDNTLVALGTVDTQNFTFNGFAPLAGNALIQMLSPNLTQTPTNFFVVADVLPTVDANTPASTPSVSAADIMTTPSTTVTGNTVTSPAPITFAPSGPTAATVTVGGRVVNSKNRGIARVTVRMTDGAGITRTASTTALGYYQFSDVRVGETFIFSVQGKGYSFTEPTQVISLTGENRSVNFRAY